MDEDLRLVALLLGVVLLVLLFRWLGTKITTNLRKRRVHLTQARRHFVKAASLVGQARSGTVTAGEARSLAGTALNEADLAIELDPNDAAILIVKSLALEQLGKSIAAVKVLDTALSERLNKSLTKEERGDTLAKRAELLLGRARGARDKLVEDALVDLEQSVTLSTKNPRAHLMLGTCYEKTGSKERAIAAFQQALVLDPASPDAKSALERLKVR